MTHQNERTIYTIKGMLNIEGCSDRREPLARVKLVQQTLNPL